MFKIDNETKTMTVIRKDTALFTVSLDNYVLSAGDKLTFTVASALDQITSLVQVNVVDFIAGSASVILNSEDTNMEPGNYLYDVQVITKDGRVDTVMGPAKFKVLGGVTN